MLEIKKSIWTPFRQEGQTEKVITRPGRRSILELTFGEQHQEGQTHRLKTRHTFEYWNEGRSF